MTGRSAWVEPGSYAVAPGVHRIPLPLPQDGLRAVNVYAIDDGDELVLIDGGWSLPESLVLFEQSLAAIERDPAHIRQIFVTHGHRDHYTQAVALRRRYGAEVLLGEGERATLEAVNSVPNGAPSSSLLRLREAGAGEVADVLAKAPWIRPVMDDWQPPDRWLTGGDLPLSGRTLTAIPTPGHTRGHLVFFDSAAGLMFTGDHVLPHITPSIGFELRPSALPLGEFLDSLRLMTQYPDAQLLPAHGPVTGSVHARVGELIAHHDQRLREVWDAVDRGATDAYQAAHRLTWTRRQTPLAELDLFNKMLAVLETSAHLNLLVRDGALKSSTVDDVVTYATIQPPVSQATAGQADHGRQSRG